MRYLAWLLLAANLGMLAWLLTQPQPQPVAYRPIPVPPGVQPLLLLSERSANSAAAAGRALAEPPPSSPPPPLPQSSSTETPPQAAPLPGAASGPGAPESDSPGETPPPVVERNAVCLAMGPLMAESEAKTLDAQLSAAGYRPHLRIGEARNPAGYWVYMPAMPASEARRIVAELDARGMTDYFIGSQNYISLGIFSVKSKARTRLEQIRALGFDAILDQRYRTRKVYWIDIEPAEKPLLVSEVWSQIQAQRPELRLQRVSCE